ncbi:hypothetical protein ACNOYE_26180 [Nannocystaceae bacterium ST9]
MRLLRNLGLAIPLTSLALAGCDQAGDSSTDDVGEAGDSGDSSESGEGSETEDGADTSTDTGETETTETTDTTGDTGSDDPAAMACEAFANAAPQMVIAAASAAEAATASLVPNDQTVYQVMLPEGAAGFVELQIPDWNTTQAFFTVADIEYTVTVVDDSQVAQPRQADAVCPDAGITDQRIFFPHWTPATIEFSATGPREIPLMVIQQPM